MIAEMCVNPDTKRPYSSAVIEKALKDSHFGMKANRSVKQHVNFYFSLIVFILSFFRHWKLFLNYKKVLNLNVLK